MPENLTWILIIGAVVLVLGTAYGIRTLFLGTPETDARRKRPTLWWYVDDYDVNTKSWATFEDRATRTPTEPYLDLCRKRANSLWDEPDTGSVNFKPIQGRLAALAALEGKVAPPPGILRTPPKLWMAWLRATLLAHLGGFWMDGSNLPLNNTKNNNIVPNEAAVCYASGTAGWAKKPGQPVWSDMSRELSDFVARGEPSWTPVGIQNLLASLNNRHGVRPSQDELTHMTNGKPLNYEQLFESTDLEASGIKVDRDRAKAKWCPLPDGRSGLETASAFLWFTRMSEEQILESDFVWAQLARGSAQ